MSTPQNLREIADHLHDFADGLEEVTAKAVDPSLAWISNADDLAAVICRRLTQHSRDHSHGQSITPLCMHVARAILEADEGKIARDARRFASIRNGKP